jgi:hypothetical protein
MINNSKKAKVLLKKRFKFTIDVEARIKDIPQALIHGDIVHRNFDRKNNLAFMQFQKRLLSAVLNNPDVVDKLLVHCAGNEAANYLNETWLQDSPDRSEENMITPAMETLSPQDKNDLRRVIDQGVFSEYTEIALYDSFIAKVIDYSIEQV